MAQTIPSSTEIITSSTKISLGKTEQTVQICSLIYVFVVYIIAYDHLFMATFMEFCLETGNLTFLTCIAH